MSKLKIAVVGATGNVGQLMIELIGDYFGSDVELIAAASERSVGSNLDSKFGVLTLVDIGQALESGPDITLFSAGATISREYAAKFSSAGSYVIDNSSAWRMDPEVPLIVPEVNGGILSSEKRLIANPNCSTIQLALVLDVLEKNYDMERVIVSTYQSVSGAGKDAVNQMEKERNGEPYRGRKPLNQVIDKNLVPHIDVFLDNGYTKEEWKIVEESRKLLALPRLKITTTCVRVPVKTGHSESVNVELKKKFEIEDIKRLLEGTSGVSVQDDPQNEIYPMPLDSEGKDEVFVGRIRRDESIPNGLNLWIVSDNLRKGAATNALQIAKLIYDNRWVGTG